MKRVRDPKFAGVAIYCNQESLKIESKLCRNNRTHSQRKNKKYTIYERN